MMNLCEQGRYPCVSFVPVVSVGVNMKAEITHEEKTLNY